MNRYLLRYKSCTKLEGPISLRYTGTIYYGSIKLNSSRRGRRGRTITNSQRKSIVPVYTLTSAPRLTASISPPLFPETAFPNMLCSYATTHPVSIETPEVTRVKKINKHNNTNFIPISISDVLLADYIFPVSDPALFDMCNKKCVVQFPDHLRMLF